MKHINIHIESLVLRGFRHDERDAVATGLEREMARVLAEAAAARRVARIGAASRLFLSPVKVEADATSHAVGTAAGRAIGDALSPPAGSTQGVRFSRRE